MYNMEMKNMHMSGMNVMIFGIGAGLSWDCTMLKF